MNMFGAILFIMCTVNIINCKENPERLGPPASDFRRHSVVQPIVQHSRNKRNIHTTRRKSGTHHSEVTVRLPLDGEEYILDLQLNQDLITDNHVLRYQENGNTVVRKPNKEEIDLCHYGGTVRAKRNSWVALSTCHGIQGVVFDGKAMKYIEPEQSGDINSKHYMYDHEDLSESYQCGYRSDATNNSNHGLNLYQKYYTDNHTNNIRIGRYKRYSSDDTKPRSPYNANKQSRYVELVLVADNREYIMNNYNVQNVYRKMKTIANIINSLYAPLNIFIALIGVEVWTDRDEIYLEADGDKTLYNFLKYTEDVLAKAIPNDNAHLLTRQNFLGDVVGKAPTKGICSNDNSGGVASNHSPVIGVVATTIAHEMGHNFGMEHDIDNLCECPDKKCIMSPSSTSVVPVHWSSCSLNSLVVSFDKGLDSCLRNKPKSLFDSPTCGNGFVEPGEQCDCGASAGGGSAHTACHACCEPATCMLRANATCGAGTCCDLRTCRPKSAGTVCRTAERECDLPEYCTGHSEYCPDDVFKMDTTPCGQNGQSAYCVGGGCRSHTDQCRLLWGTTGHTSDYSCYKFNQKGNRGGHCGYDKLRNTFIKCSETDELCGTVKCTHLTKEPQISFKTYHTQQIITEDTVTECYTVNVNMITQEDMDLGMVPDGAKCGHEKMCLKQRCVSLADVRQSITKFKTSVFPSNCSGHGVCNSAGHCHCDPGFAPPLCAWPGPGGSYDSRPATDPDSAYAVMVAIYVLFLGIVPLILLVLYLMYRYYPKALQGCYNKLRESVKYPQFDRSHNNKTHLNSNENDVQVCKAATMIEAIKIEHANANISNPDRSCDEPIYANFQPIYANVSIANFNDSKNEISRPIRKFDKKHSRNAGEIINKNGVSTSGKTINNHDIQIDRENININDIQKATINKDKKDVSISRNSVAKHIAEAGGEINDDYTKRRTHVNNNDHLADKITQKFNKQTTWKKNNDIQTDIIKKFDTVPMHMQNDKDGNAIVKKDFGKNLVAKNHNTVIQTASKRIIIDDIKMIRNQLNTGHRVPGNRNFKNIPSSNTAKRGESMTPIDNQTHVSVKKLISAINNTATDSQTGTVNKSNSDLNNIVTNRR